MIGSSVEEKPTQRTWPLPMTGQLSSDTFETRVMCKSVRVFSPPVVLLSTANMSSCAARETRRGMRRHASWKPVALHTRR